MTTTCSRTYTRPVVAKSGVVRESQQSALASGTHRQLNGRRSEQGTGRRVDESDSAGLLQDDYSATREFLDRRRRRNGGDQRVGELAGSAATGGDDDERPTRTEPVTTAEMASRRRIPRT